MGRHESSTGVLEPVHLPSADEGMIPELERPSRTGRLATVAAVALAAATVVGMVLLWPGESVRERVPGLEYPQEALRATVLSVVSEPCGDPGAAGGQVLCEDVRFTLDEGPDQGRTVSLQLTASSDNDALDTGDQVLLSDDPAAERDSRYAFVERYRRPALVWLALIFAAAVVLLGGLRGIAALAGLAASFAVLVMFVLPSIIVGNDPPVVAAVGAAAIAFLALYPAHGFNTRTTIALLGTLAGLGVALLLGTVFVGAAHFAGLGNDEAFVVRLGAENVNLAGLLLAGVLIGALGAIADIAVMQASAVWELRKVNPGMGTGELVRAALRSGRDHVTSTLNTLVLAYAGASMPVLVLFLLSGQSLGLFANGESVAAEIIRTLVGSIGLISCVPLTTWLAVRVAADIDPDLPPVPARRPVRRRRQSQRKH